MTPSVSNDSNRGQQSTRADIARVDSLDGVFGATYPGPGLRETGYFAFSARSRRDFLLRNGVRFGGDGRTRTAE